MASENKDITDKADRKKDHIEMAFEAVVDKKLLDERFYYEPLLSGHPQGKAHSFSFLGKEMKNPLWVSSMTGGTKWARKINANLAQACAEFGLGMGLGSCRPLLDGSQHYIDFDVRHIIGNEQPLFANIGIAQLQELQSRNEEARLEELVDKLQTDGLIIHVNPMQEWLQPEGDRYFIPPLESISSFLESSDIPLIVKEVGHGFGPESMKALLKLPLAAIDFGANGGTNFSKLEMMRSGDEKRRLYRSLAFVGHSSEDMLQMLNVLVKELGKNCACRQVIISGGVPQFLDGFYLVENSSLPAVYGQAGAFLRNARDDYNTLQKFVQGQIDGYRLADQFLRIRKSLKAG